MPVDNVCFDRRWRCLEVVAKIESGRYGLRSRDAVPFTALCASSPDIDLVEPLVVHGSVLLYTNATRRY